MTQVSVSATNAQLPVFFSLSAKKIYRCVWIALLLISILSLVLHFLFFRYSFPPVNVDEASFFSPAYDFSMKGILSSDVHKNFLPGAASHTYWMPPFYMVVLALFLKITGPTVFNAKLLSFILTCVSAAAISKLSNNRYAKIILPALFLISPFVIITSAYIRMEALAVLLIILSILYIRLSNRAWIAGLLAGFLFMTHPMLLPCSFSLFIIAIRRGKPFLLIFLITALATVMPYFIYILQDWNSFQLQMALQLSRKSSHSLFSLKVEYLVQLFFLVSIGLGSLLTLKKSGDLKIFLLVALITTFLLALKSNEFNYHVYLVPYVLAGIALKMEEGSSGLYNYFFPIAVYAIFSTLLFLKASKYKFQTDDAYNELTNFLNYHTEWKNKNIYVNGNPDLASFLIMKHQSVERKNAVASLTNDNWQQKYNCIIEVKNLPENQNLQAKEEWCHWTLQQIFITSDKRMLLRLLYK